MEYPSTKNLYESNKINGPEHKRGPEFGFSSPAFEQISQWLVTEKVDGMNMRVVWDQDGDNRWLSIYGRTDRAQIPRDLLSLMQDAFTPESMSLAFGTWNEEGGFMTLPDRVVLFGEGFGPGIQKAGQAYGGVKRFALFDVVVDDHWLAWDGVEDVARKLGVPTVPVLDRAASLQEAIDSVRRSQLQDPASGHVEGIVVRTDPYLFDGRGNRVVFKYKVRDL